MTRENQVCYQISVKGVLDPDWSDWLNGFEVHTEAAPDGTCTATLTGAIMDQAALRGMLNKICDLNLELISLSRLKIERWKVGCITSLQLLSMA